MVPSPGRRMDGTGGHPPWGWVFDSASGFALDPSLCLCSCCLTSPELTVRSSFYLFICFSVLLFKIRKGKLPPKHFLEIKLGFYMFLWGRCPVDTIHG